MEQPIAMTEETVLELLEKAGAKAASRGGRSDSYGAPREFSFEVRGMFPNGMGLHIVARQYNYRDPWEAEGRVNDMVDVSLLRGNSYTSLPKGHQWFQGIDEESGVDEAGLREIIDVVKGLNPKIYDLQKLTGDF